MPAAKKSGAQVSRLVTRYWTDSRISRLPRPRLTHGEEAAAVPHSYQDSCRFGVVHVFLNYFRWRRDNACPLLFTFRCPSDLEVFLVMLDYILSTAIEGQVILTAFLLFLSFFSRLLDSVLSSKAQTLHKFEVTLRPICVTCSNLRLEWRQALHCLWWDSRRSDLFGVRLPEFSKSCGV